MRMRVRMREEAEEADLARRMDTAVRNIAVGWLIPSLPWSPSEHRLPSRGITCRVIPGNAGRTKYSMVGSITFCLRPFANGKTPFAPCLGCEEHACAPLRRLRLVFYEFR